MQSLFPGKTTILQLVPEHADKLVKLPASFMLSFSLWVCEWPALVCMFKVFQQFFQTGSCWGGIKDSTTSDVLAWNNDWIVARLSPLKAPKAANINKIHILAFDLFTSLWSDYEIDFHLFRSLYCYCQNVLSDFVWLAYQLYHYLSGF